MIATDILDENTELATQEQQTLTVQSLEQANIFKLTREEQDEIYKAMCDLPSEIIAESVELCFKMVILSLQSGNVHTAQEWQAKLISKRDSAKEGTPTRKIIDNRIHCTTLCFPITAGSNLLLNIAVLANGAEFARFPLARISITAKFPSVIRGAKDLSALAKHYRATASIVRPLLATFLEDDGAGVCEAGIAEVLYELNDLNGAALNATGAINVNNPEIQFVALAILARLGAVDNTAQSPSEILARIGDILQKKQAHWLVENYNALCTRFDMLYGDNDKVRSWLEQCSINDLDKIAVRDSYVLITKAKAYISLGEYRNAATLLESLTTAMQKQQRPLDTIECLVNGAIACELMGSGDTAIQKLEKALLMAQEYGYIRVFSDCGKQIFQLLMRYKKENALSEDLNMQFVKKIIESAKIFSTICPALYQNKSIISASEDESVGELTQSELTVLMRLDSGKSNKNIARDLNVQPSTVNFHLTNIFQKLDAENRTEAIKKARDKGIIA